MRASGQRSQREALALIRARALPLPPRVGLVAALTLLGLAVMWLWGG